MFSYDHQRRMRGAALSGVVLALILGFAPQALATDIADIGFVDQSALFLARGLRLDFRALLRGPAGKLDQWRHTRLQRHRRPHSA